MKTSLEADSNIETDNDMPIHESTGVDSEQLEKPSSPSKSETREIVTPYAFTVSPDLLGKPLATPSRRGIAILIDLFLISVLSTISALVFAGFVALTFFRAGNQLGEKNAKHYTKLALKGSAAIIVFFLVFVVTKNLDDDSSTEKNFQIDENEIIEIAQTVAINACKTDEACVLEALQSLNEYYVERNTSREEVQLAYNEFLGKSDLSVSSEEKVLNALMTEFDQSIIQQTEAPLVSTTTQDAQSKPEQDKSSIIATPDTTSNASYSIVEWVKGIMSDLGLGLGWAALYFSVFTAWWNGQTIGKRLMGIKVVRLDGSTPTLWESFGRYGGYGAGFATGLLGFLQLYWDPNRQAIQDKISETLVLRVNR